MPNFYKSYRSTISKSTDIQLHRFFTYLSEKNCLQNCSKLPCQNPSLQLVVIDQPIPIKFPFPPNSQHYSNKQILPPKMSFFCHKIPKVVNTDNHIQLVVSLNFVRNNDKERKHRQQRLEAFKKLSARLYSKSDDFNFSLIIQLYSIEFFFASVRTYC